jgi:aminoglycoside phosphotransferase (APT) family kinase protein
VAADTAAALRKATGCPACGAFDRWRAVGCADVRANSTLLRFGCAQCGERIVVKLAPPGGGPVDAGQLIRREYETLLMLQQALQAHDGYDALTPVGYLDVGGRSAMVTRMFLGHDLQHHARTANVAALSGLFRRSGQLLRLIHDACPRAYPPRSLDVKQKLAYLAQTHGAALRRNRAAVVAWRRLEESATRVGAHKLRWAWGHGDFKPENVLYDGHTLAVFDTTLESYGAFVYDMASFLDHTWLAGFALPFPGRRRHFQELETAFLAGYGGLTSSEIAALRWAQLYFALCYFGRYSSGGMASALYARWRISPLVKSLTTQRMA